MSVSAGVCQHQQTHAVISFRRFGSNNAYTIACSSMNTIRISLIAIRSWNSLLFRGSENCSQADIYEYSCDVFEHASLHSRSQIATNLHITFKVKQAKSRQMLHQPDSVLLRANGAYKVPLHLFSAVTWLPFCSSTLLAHSGVRYHGFVARLFYSHITTANSGR